MTTLLYQELTTHKARQLLELVVVGAGTIVATREPDNSLYMTVDVMADGKATSVYDGVVWERSDTPQSLVEAKEIAHLERSDVLDNLDVGEDAQAFPPAHAHVDSCTHTLIKLEDDETKVLVVVAGLEGASDYDISSALAQFVAKSLPLIAAAVH